MIISVLDCVKLKEENKLIMYSIEIEDILAISFIQFDKICKAFDVRSFQEGYVEFVFTVFLKYRCRL